MKLMQLVGPGLMMEQVSEKRLSSEFTFSKSKILLKIHSDKDVFWNVDSDSKLSGNIVLACFGKAYASLDDSVKSFIYSDD